MEKQRGALRITALNAAALANGLGVGMALTQARALWPALQVADAKPEADAAFLMLCAEACDMFTPLVALRGGGVMLDITGCAHLFGGERGMLAGIRHRFARAGLAVSGAIARTPEAAWAFARHRPGLIVAPGEEEEIARALPIAALDPDGETALALTRAGLRTVGDLADRPAAILTARFGSALFTTLRRVLGQEDARITPLRAAPELMAERHFSEPLAQMDSLLATLERLAGDIESTLTQRQAGGRAFEASFFRTDGAVRRIRIETAQALRDPAVLIRLVRLQIEALSDPLDPGFGFDAVRLAVIRSEKLPERQQDLDGRAVPESASAEVAALVDRLVARFGRESLRRFVLRDTHDPVAASGTVACLSAVEETPSALPEPGQPPDRPLTLFDPPQCIEALAEVPDGPPLRFRWRRVLHDVARAEGPERIAPEWWRTGDRAPDTRDYYRIEDAQGHRFWVFREGFFEDSNARPRWFLHGLFA